MEVFSLEEDDYAMFITQSERIVSQQENYDGILGDPSDFKSPVRSVLSEGATQYSDISDDDDAFQLPQGKLMQEEPKFE